MKNSTLKVALVAVATIMGLNGFAQTNTGSTQWTVQTTVNDYVSTAGNKVTAGKAMPFWVWPSAAYNPYFDYTAIPTFATKAQISNNVLSAFAWSATGTAPVVTNEAADKNYATILWPVADIGNQTVSVTETPASGVCSATPVTFAVTVIGAPDFTITTGASTFGLTNEIQHACWVAGNNQTAIPFVNNNASEVYPFDFYLDYKIYTVDGLDGSGKLPATGGNLNTGDVSVSVVYYDNKVNGVVAGVPNKTTNPIVVTTPSTNLLPAAVDFGVVGGKITVYEFDMSGYNGKVSRTSDYLALNATNVSNYGTYSQYGTAAKYYIIALPAPVTGPIYHIANSFGL